MDDENKVSITLSEEGKVAVRDGGFGLFFEDINYGLDGGLYAEMLENRNFEAKDVHGEWDNYIVEHDGGYAWEVYPAGASVQLKIKTDRPLFIENPHYMRILASESGAGMKNKAYDGLYLKKGMGYKISFYARAYDFKGRVLVSVRTDDILFEKKIKLKADGKWHKYTCRFKSKTDADGAAFTFTLTKAGDVHADCFSMMPEDAVLGVFRRDLVELLRGMKPGFLRFPGGCVVEGNNLANRYLWKNSIGQTERRKHNWNRWAVHGVTSENGFRSVYSHYGQTLGVGYYEYFRLCEYLGAKPLPVVSVGLACQYMSTETVPLDDPELETYIQEALDVIEFANGGTDTVWGSVRAQMGHPEPFGLEYLGVGNEQWQTESTAERAGSQFYERFELFEKRLHERYPELKIVGTAGPTVDTDTHRSAWKWTLDNLKKNPDFVYCTDEHFYVSPEWLYSHVHMYDKYPREGLVYAGEYAAHIPEAGCGLFNAPQANVWEGALAEAAFMTGMERNADVVVMKSYAPLFARLGYTQWSPDMIWFNGKTAYGSASYHVQRLYSLYTGKVSYPTVTDREKVYASATGVDAFVFVKIVNAERTPLQAEFSGDFDFGALTRIVCIHNDLSDYNTLEDPDKVAPEEIAPSAARSLTLPPYSFSVLVFKK